jgi:alpha-beta hydrolase superfamily lysophospholipase
MSNRWPVRRVVVALSVVAALVSVGAFDAVFTGVAVAAKAPASFTQGPAGRAFYNPPGRLPAGAHGKLIWARRIPAPKGAIAWKVLYKSKLVSGKMVPVSGLVIAPTGKAPKGGRKVIAWAHGTLGGARSCAPSIPYNPARNLSSYYTYNDPDFIDVGVPALTKFLAAGDVVTATDYQGLGAPGVHQYTVGLTEANNVIDSVKAAAQLPGVDPGKRVVTLGWSQGGGAAIFTGQQGEAAYAKPLKVVGIAALAPAANNGPDLSGQVAMGPVDSTSPYVLAVQELNVIRGYAAAYPGLSVSTMVTAAGMPALNALNVECTIHLQDTLQELGVDPRTFFTGPFPAAWQARFNQNTAGLETTVAPVLTMQGTTDTVVNPNGTTQYIARACQFTQPVEYSIYPGVNHQVIPFAAMNEYVGWIAARFAGKPAPSNCASP